MRAIVNGHVHPVTGEGPIEDGTVLVEDGAIAAVGADVDVPADADVLDADGRPVTPGLVDAHSHAGIVEWGNPADADWDELLSPRSPHVSALDGFHPRDEALARACRGGVTALGVLMGSANVIGGVVCSMKTHGTVADDMLLREDGMKAALGENPKGMGGYPNEDQEPVSRPGVAAMLRQALVDAEDYRDRKRHTREADEPFDRDLGMENLVRVLDGNFRLRVHAHRADDIHTAFRIADEFDVESLSIEHATEGHLLAEEFAARDVPAVLGPCFYSGRKYEVRNIAVETAAVLHDAGVTIALQTDAPVLPQGYLDVLATLAVREGLPEDAALAAITRNPAEILGVEERVGTLRAGTDADLVVWDAPVLDARSRTAHVFVDGEHVFNRRRDGGDIDERR